jgi:poly-beta-1,6-N-acetyl-D-glucosamine N-deacetylase
MFCHTMTGKIYSLIHLLIRFSGIADLCRLIFAKNNVSIILYHNPKPEIFEKHLKYLCRRYNLISLAEFSQAICTKDWKSIPSYALIITMDDGWKENYNLLPVIIQFRIRPTIFLTSHIINTERHFWWTTCNIKDIERLKNIPNKQRMNELLEECKYYPEKEYVSDRQALNIPEIKIMKDYVDFGLHTCFHPILTSCSHEEKRNEIMISKITIERILGRVTETFAYPNGDYDQECIEMLKECGIKIARTIDAGWNNKSSDPYKLKVTGVSDDGSISKLMAELTGIPMFFQYLSKGSFNGRKNSRAVKQ